MTPESTLKGTPDYRELLRRSWQHRHPAPRAADPAFGREAAPVADPSGGGLRRRLHDRFLQEIERERGIDTGDRAATRRRVRQLVDQTLSADELAALSARDRAQLEDEVMAEILGLGPLAPLFADPTVSDILVNGPGEVWVDRFGRLERTGVIFDDEAHLLRLLNRLVSAHGRHLDEASPHVDFRLPDGTRLHALIPPLCSVPVISVRRSRPIPFRLEELIACDTLSPAMGELLRTAVRARLNILVSGGTASGKTTFLNVLSGFIPEGERVVSIEETAELRLDHPHVVALEARLPNIEGKGEVTLRTLVKNSLRMRPDRIIVGEVRGAEAFDMLQAMNTGHQGSLTTVHANTPGDALRRLENLVLMGGFELPSRAIRELLGAAFDLVVQLQRFPEGTRRTVAVEEVLLEPPVESGPDQESGLRTRALFRFEGGDPKSGPVDGRYAATGHRPRFLDRLVRAGLDAEAVFPASRKEGT